MGFANQVRLMLVLTPIMCVLGAIGISSLMDTWTPLLKGKQNRTFFLAGFLPIFTSCAFHEIEKREFRRKTHHRCCSLHVLHVLLPLALHVGHVGGKCRPPQHTHKQFFFSVVVGVFVTVDCAGVQESRPIVANLWWFSRVLSLDQPEHPRVRVQCDACRILGFARIFLFGCSDARIMSWWDYGYQLAGMSNRTVLVDNNTWNNTHIAQVGKGETNS